MELGGEVSHTYIPKDTESVPLARDEEEEKEKLRQEKEKMLAEKLAEEKKKTVLDNTPSDRLPYFLISNCILATACHEYQKYFNSSIMPGKFIQFYIFELSSYNFEFNQDISNFFNTFFADKYNETKLIFEMFKKSFPTYIKKIGRNGKDCTLHLDPLNKDIQINYELVNNTPSLLDTKERIDRILEHYIHNDELFNIEQLYKMYLVQEELNAYIKRHYKPIINKQEENSTNTKNNDIYIGKETKVVEEKGKVFQLRVPKFELPLKYPTSLTKSLLHKTKSLSRLLDPADTITIINKYRITKVRENQHFIDKRKNLLTPQKSKYASFLDSF